jgi:trehalose 6-phosphate synthase/phosphatase
VGSYRAFRAELDGLVGRLNGSFGTTNWMPVHYLYRSISDQDLIALYRAADVMLVTPLRDGMNLVAKEFVATRSDEDGVLVLSEFAGAADEMSQAMIVNPYDLEDTAEAYHRALTMSRSERREHMRALRVRVFEYDVHAWSADFLRTLDPEHPLVSDGAGIGGSPGRLSDFSTAGLPPNALDSWANIADRFDERIPVLFLDYDGTLTPIMQRPEQAVLSVEMRELLRRVADVMPVVLMSGRAREDLISRVGIPAMIYAGSHGFDISGPGDLRHQVAGDFVPLIHETAEQLAREFAPVPGVFIEEKRLSVGVHYRLATHADSMRVIAHVDALTARDARLQKRYGKKVIELRPAVDWDKGKAVSWICERVGIDSAVILPIYIGDDLTDEDAFEALQGTGVTIVVKQSARPTHASFSLRNVPEVRLLLERLLARHSGPVGVTR